MTGCRKKSGRKKRNRWEEDMITLSRGQLARLIFLVDGKRRYHIAIEELVSRVLLKGPEEIIEELEVLETWRDYEQATERSASVIRSAL